MQRAAFRMKKNPVSLFWIHGVRVVQGISPDFDSIESLGCAGVELTLELFESPVVKQEMYCDVA